MINVGVIGVGNMGLHHARNYSQIPNVRLCAVADFDKSRAYAVAARFGGTPYGDYREMLEREQLDAVSVVVPTRDHLTVASDVIAAGVNLLVEKPLAANVADGEAIVSAAHGRGVKLAVGHIERFNPAVQELKRRVDAGALGAILSVIAKRVGVLPPQVKDANVINDLAVHDIDILNYFFGAMPTEVFGSAGRAILSDRYDHAEIFLKYPATSAGQALAVGCFVQVNWITPLKIRTLSVTGDAGYAEVNYVTQKLEIYESNLEREYNDFGDFVVRFGEARRTVVPLPVREPLRAELDDFVDAVANDRAPQVRGEVGVAVLRVVRQVEEALTQIADEKA